MQKFRKKPVVIEAVQFWRSGDDEIMALDLGINFENGEERMVIPTLEGVMYASKGDWIIRGVKGELYPCKPDIFEATYERVNE